MLFGFWAALAVAGIVGCADKVDEFEAKRAALLARPRTVITDNDGNDIVYYDRDRPVTEQAFIDSRIGSVAKTRAQTMVYCPWSSGFGRFTVPDIGELYTGYYPYANTTNRTVDFLAKGLDPLKMAVDFCRREEREIFLGIRMNDIHDAYCADLNWVTKWKRDHPDCLVGKKTNKGNARFTWSAVDYGHEEVRAYQLDFMRKFLERYDLDGVEYDFFRHPVLFGSVVNATDEKGAEATPEQLDLMSRHMAALRALTEEVGRKRGKPILVAIRVPDSFGYCRAMGVDLARWLKEKSVDLVVGGGYFQLNPWQETARKVHALGGKFYVSLDESRIGDHAVQVPLGVLPGRKTLAFYAARMAAAMASGADGVYFFNCQGKALEQYASINPNATEGCTKAYFAIERGTGGDWPALYVYKGERFSMMPKLDPGKPLELKPGQAFGFSLSVGDDFGSSVAREHPPVATAEVLVKGMRPDAVSLSVNGTMLGKPSVKPGARPGTGVLSFAVPVAALKRGANALVLTAGAEPCTVADFVLRVLYPQKGK